MPSSLHGLALEWPYILLVTGIILGGLWLSNFAFDKGIPQYVSRKIGHIGGGICFLLAPFIFKHFWIPLILAVAFTTMLLLARAIRPATFRGVGGNGRDSDSYAEVVFAGVAIPVYLVGWQWLKQPYYATAALLFMAWGDAATGLIRARVYHKPVKGIWGSVGMLLVCLVLAWLLIKPFWVGIGGSLAAVAAEYSFGDVGFIKRIDDNLAIPLISLAALIMLSN